LDNRTTLSRQNRDGMTYEIDRDPKPPRRPNCRSTTIPIPKGWEELELPGDEVPKGTRASVDGQVSRLNRTVDEMDVPGPFSEGALLAELGGDAVTAKAYRALFGPVMPRDVARRLGGGEEVFRDAEIGVRYKDGRLGLLLVDSLSKGTVNHRNDGLASNPCGGCRAQGAPSPGVDGP